MSDYTESGRNLLDFIKKRDFLFRKGIDDFSLTDYLKWFEKRTGKQFFTFPSLLPYRGELIDLYAKKVVNSPFIPTSSGLLALHTIVQLSPDCHNIFIYGTSERTKNVLVYSTMYAADYVDFFKFVDESSSYVLEDEKHAGFTGFGKKSEDFG